MIFTNVLRGCQKLAKPVFIRMKHHIQQIHANPGSDIYRMNNTRCAINSVEYVY
jgi:hypothetical protein